MVRIVSHRLRVGAASIVAIVTVFAVASCGDGYNSPTSSNVSRTSVTAKMYAFTPSTITIGTSNPTMLRITSLDMQHTFTIDALGINATIPAGGSTDVDLSGVANGTYTFYCAMPGHRAAGMAGTLTINRTSSTGY